MKESLQQINQDITDGVVEFRRNTKMQPTLRRSKLGTSDETYQLKEQYSSESSEDSQIEEENNFAERVLR